MRVALYTRVSTERQSQEGFSLEAQHDQLIAHINTHNMQLFKVYSDPGVSAKNLKRPGVQEMIRDLKDGLFDAVIVHKLDRLTRNISDLYDLIELFNKKGIQLISLSENIDTSNPMGRMFVFLMGILAQMYRENLADEVTKGMRKRAEKGMHNITVNLYGYERGENGELLVKEEEAKWIRYIFDQYLSGAGSNAIAKSLNEFGVRRNQGARWDRHKVFMALRNHHYTGKIHWKSVKDEKAVIREGAHAAIISEDIFERAQRMAERRKGGLVSKNSYEYVYGGILRCANCGAKYSGKFTKYGDTTYRRYDCVNTQKFGICNQGGISEIKLTKLLFNSLDLIGKDYSRKDMPKQEKTEEEQLRKSIRESEARRERWQLAYGDGNMPYDDFSKRMKDEMERLQELEDKLSTITPQIVSYLTPDEAIKTVNSLKEHWEFIEPKERKEIIQSLFQEIVIKREGKKWSIEKITTT